jgi:hypothetical protein
MTGFQRSVPSYGDVRFSTCWSEGRIAEDGASACFYGGGLTPPATVLSQLLGVSPSADSDRLHVDSVCCRIRWADHSWVFFGFLSLFALASASLGILLGTLFKDPDKCATTAVWVAILLAPIGGLWWPLELVGPAMRRLAYFVPTGWAMEGVNTLLAFGGSAVRRAFRPGVCRAVQPVSRWRPPPEG